MRKWFGLMLAMVLLLCCTSCDEKSDILSATSEYNGKTITMSYKVTDVKYPWDMRSVEMQQGYAVFYDYTFWDSLSNTNPYPGDTWNILDRDGNRLLTEPYKHLAPFNKAGITVAQKMDGSYVQLNTKLEETLITEQEHLDFCLDSKNNMCSKTYPKGEFNYSCINNDIAIYVEFKNETNYVGLVDKDGSVIIPAFIPISYNKMVEHLHISEDTAFVEDATTGNIGIITITRS
ncbi:MAG: hypothetical protein E7541_05295 [Ruminococcaceae bacterium]|nr:hypothetical protein [Oscillospiraceae bacterium]